MSKLLSMDEIAKIIIDYVTDERKKQAVLLDGEWGCGKTFFVNKVLRSELEKDYQVFQISLYGISNVDKIQDIIYSKWLESMLEEKAGKLGHLGNLLTKGIDIFGKSAISFIESKLGTEGSATEAGKEALDKIIGKNKKLILIFDDIERCQINIIELMGFLNNLCENNEYKLILIANEKEINRENDDISIAIKYGIALNNRLDVDNLFDKKTTSNADKINKENLKAITDYYFGEKTTFERTREKLIGLTIPYNISIEESFDEIINKNIKSNDVKEIIIMHKNSVIDLFETNLHRNLRTLVTSCIALEKIISVIIKIKVEDKNLLIEEYKRIILYTLFSAMKKTDGKSEYKWSANTRYGYVNDSLFEGYANRLWGYAFVDEYWKTQCIDKEVICTDINNIISERLSVKKLCEERDAHKSLALVNLIDWYMFQDDEVKRLISQMKNELAEKRYYPQEFKDIIVTLMQINNPNYGLNPDKIRKESNVIFDSTESSQFIGMIANDTKENSNCFDDWETINISEFVELMIKYFEDKDFQLNERMLRIISEDKQFVYDYRQIIMPLIEQINQNQEYKVISNDNGLSITDMKWNDEFKKTCIEKRLEFAEQGKFLSLFEYDKVIDKLEDEDITPAEIHCFCSALRKVYNYSNISDVFSSDYEMIESIHNYISENICTTLNPNKSRTKKIALKKLLSDISMYSNQLRNIT